MLGACVVCLVLSYFVLHFTEKGSGLLYFNLLKFSIDQFRFGFQDSINLPELPECHKSKSPTIPSRPRTIGSYREV